MAVGVIEIERFFGKTKNRVAKIGLELEGGWWKLPAETQLVHDGSVFSNGAPAEVAAAAPEVRAKFKHGELPSEPMPPIRVESWMRKFYPQFIDSTCGLHVHMSFEDAKYYSRLMIPEFPETVRIQFKQWALEQKLKDNHPLWERLAGRSIFCQQKFWPDMQAQTRRKDHDQRREGHRYTDINYCHGTHGTLECRLLPMMQNVDQGISAVQRLIGITNAALVALARKEENRKLGLRRLRERVELGQEDRYEEECIEVL